MHAAMQSRFAIFIRLILLRFFSSFSFYLCETRCFFLFEYVTVYCIFAMTIADFDAIGSPLSEAVVKYLIWC